MVDAAGDSVIELAGEGYDTVVASLSTTLAVNTERLMLAGSAEINATGNAQNNRIDGNLGANRLAGAAGNNDLYGGLGADSQHTVFDFGAAGTLTVLNVNPEAFTPDSFLF